MQWQWPNHALLPGGASQCAILLLACDSIPKIGTSERQHSTTGFVLMPTTSGTSAARSEPMGGPELTCDCKHSTIGLDLFSILRCSRTLLQSVRGEDPSDSSFRRAMRKASGTVSIVDKSAVCYTHLRFDSLSACGLPWEQEKALPSWHYPAGIIVRIA